MKHYIQKHLLTKPVKIVLIGGGGSGSRVLENLVCLHKALLAKGHPHGLDVHLVDDDRVSAANVGRQAFYPCDVGSYKAITLINRANMALGDTNWTAHVVKLTTHTTGFSSVDFVIGAVDNRSARLSILRCLERAGGGTRYWLDLGNRLGDGQVVLGQVTSGKRKTDDEWRLPHIGELFPELVQPKLDKEEDDIPSCSLAEALEKQSLFINTAVSLFACNLLWQLFTAGEIQNHGAFVNLEYMSVMPIGIDHDEWARFGVVRDGKRNKVLSK